MGGFNMNEEFDFPKVCRYFAIVILILGIIGSLALANDLGVTYDTSGYYLIEERNWGTTIGIFLGGALCSAFVSSILWFFSEAISYLSNIMKKILEIKEKLSDD